MFPLPLGFAAPPEELSRVPLAEPLASWTDRSRLRPARVVAKKVRQPFRRGFVHGTTRAHQRGSTALPNITPRIAESKVSRAVALLRLPEDLQERVESGEISARSAYELSKLDSDEKRRQLADRVTAEKLTHDQAAKAVRQRKGARKKTASRAIRLTFPAENGWKITAQRCSPSNYHELEAALVNALEEVRLRLNNNVQLF